MQGFVSSFMDESDHKSSSVEEKNIHIQEAFSFIVPKIYDCIAKKTEEIVKKYRHKTLTHGSQGKSFISQLQNFREENFSSFLVYLIKFRELDKKILEYLEEIYNTSPYITLSQLKEIFILKNEKDIHHLLSKIFKEKRVEDLLGEWLNESIRYFLRLETSTSVGKVFQQLTEDASSQDSVLKNQKPDHQNSLDKAA